VTHKILIEPADEHRQEFARWCLAQQPRIETASATGSAVPVDLYPEVPVELLEGAYVDGYLYRSADPKPAVRPDGAQPPAQARSSAPRRQGGKRKPRAAQTAAQGGSSKAADEAVIVAVASATEGGSEQ